MFQCQFFQLDAKILTDHHTIGQDGNITQQGLAAITKSGCFDSTNIEYAAQLVDHQCGERITFDVFGYDQQRFTGLAHFFQNRDQVAKV